MTRRKRAVLELAHPNAAGIDIGSASHFVAAPSDRDDEPVRESLITSRGGKRLPANE